MDDSLNLIPVTLSEYVKLNHEDVAFYIETLTTIRSLWHSKELLG